MQLDLRPLALNARDTETSQGRTAITCNTNGIPCDPQKPTVTSGIRLGSPAATTGGFGPDEFRLVGQHIVEVLRALARGTAENGGIEAGVREKVRELCARFPVYREFGAAGEPGRMGASADGSN